MFIPTKLSLAEFSLLVQSSDVKHTLLFIFFTAGGGGTLSGTSGGLRKGSDVPVPGLGGIRVGEKSLIELASRGEDGVPVTCLVTLAKYAYTYEQWDHFDLFMDAALTAIRVRWAKYFLQ